MKVDVWSEAGAALAREALEELEAGNTITLGVETNSDGNPATLTVNRDHPMYRKVVLMLNRIMLGDQAGLKAMQSS